MVFGVSELLMGYQSCLLKSFFFLKKNAHLLLYREFGIHFPGQDLVGSYKH